MPSEPVEELRTARLALEPLRVDHADEMSVVLADGELYEFIGGRAPTLDELTERYRSLVIGSGRDEERWLNWVVRRSDDGRAIGYVQATVYDDDADVAWLIGRVDQGRGYAAESVEAMVRWLSQHGVVRFTAHIAADHRRSAAVATSLGFSPTGATDDDGEQIWAGTASTMRPSS